MSYVVKTVSAQLKHDTQTFGKMDPYVVVYIGLNKQRGKTCEDGGKKPVFSDIFTFKEGDGELLNIQLWDEDVSQDDLIGQGAVNLASFKAGPTGGQDIVNVPLTYKGSDAGSVKLAITYHMSGILKGGVQPQQLNPFAGMIPQMQMPIQTTMQMAMMGGLPQYGTMMMPQQQPTMMMMGMQPQQMGYGGGGYPNMMMMQQQPMPGQMPGQMMMPQQQPGQMQMQPGYYPGQQQMPGGYNPYGYR